MSIINFLPNTQMLDLNSEGLSLRTYDGRYECFWVAKTLNELKQKALEMGSHIMHFDVITKDNQNRSFLANGNIYEEQAWQNQSISNNDFDDCDDYFDLPF